MPDRVNPAHVFALDFAAERPGSLRQKRFAPGPFCWSWEADYDLREERVYLVRFAPDWFDDVPTFQVRRASDGKALSEALPDEGEAIREARYYLAQPFVQARPRADLAPTMEQP